MQSRKDELSSLIDSALNLENIVNFKSLHKLLHEIVDLLGSDERNESRRFSDAGIDQISSSANYVNHFVGLEGLQGRIDTLERNMERLQRDHAIRHNPGVNERSLVSNSTFIPTQSEDNSGIRGNNVATDAESLSTIIEHQIDEAVTIAEEKDTSAVSVQETISSNVISHGKNRGGSGKVKTSVITRDDPHVSSGNRITELSTETTPHVDNGINHSINSSDYNSIQRDISVIEVIGFPQSSEGGSENQLFPSYSLPDSIAVRLSTLEIKYEHFRDELDSLQNLREQLREKLSIEVFESVMMEWEHSSRMIEKKYNQEKSQVNDKLETFYNCLTSVERNMIGQLNGLKKFLAEELMKVEEQLRKVQRSERKVFDEAVEAAGGKSQSSGNIACISCNRYVTMRLREPHCRSVVAQPLTRTALAANPIPSKRFTERFSQKSREKRHAGGKHTVISIDDKQTRSEMQKENDNKFMKKLICVDTENANGNEKILGGIVGILASQSYDSIN